jgi:hypothetical protein
MGRKGIAMIFVILMMSVLLVLGLTLTRIVFSSSSGIYAHYDQIKAYYLAEAAIEFGKDKVRANPSWCSPGQLVSTPTGKFEIKREPGSTRLLAQGIAGRARAIITYDLNTRLQREEY